MARPQHVLARAGRDGKRRVPGVVLSLVHDRALPAPAVEGGRHRRPTQQHGGVLLPARVLRPFDDRGHARRPCHGQPAHEPHAGLAGVLRPASRARAHGFETTAPMTLLPLAGPFLVALVVSFGATLLCERVARRAGLVAHPREDRWHRESVPLLGGVAIMVAMAVVGLGMGAHLARFLPLLVLSASMGAVGIVDDVKTLRPQTKLAAQIIGAAVLIQVGALFPLTPFAVVNVPTWISTAAPMICAASLV